MEIRYRRESWPLARSFVISRGRKSTAEVLVVEIEHGAAVGRGEAVPYARYGETFESVSQQLNSVIPALKIRVPDAGVQASLQTLLPAGAARNALDCALWDVRAKLSGRRVYELAGLPKPLPVVISATVGVVGAEELEARLPELADTELIKIKLGDDWDLERVRRVCQVYPSAKVVVDANEGWSQARMHELLPRLAELGVALVEQPLPAGQDSALASRTAGHPLLCADESFHTLDDLPDLSGRYDVVNLKLDKCGGLTAAIECRRAALASGFQLMVGCMVATSWSMAAAHLLCRDAAFVDLDGAQLLARDREGGCPDWQLSDGLCPASLWG